MSDAAIAAMLAILLFDKAQRHRDANETYEAVLSALFTLLCFICSVAALLSEPSS